MNIQPTIQPSFGKIKNMPQKLTRFYIPANNGTLRCEVVGDFGSKITNIKYDILHKGKVVESKKYQNKKGFDEERFGSICEIIQKKVREGINFFDELIKAQFKNGN